MDKKIRIKAVIFYSTVLLITIILFDLYFEPGKFLNFDFLYKRLDKITAAQKIAPQRLFVNVWRSAKNEYADTSMNQQNWLKWRNKYLKYIKTTDDADIAINTMLASLNDPYTKFLKTDMYLKQQEIVDSKVTGLGIIFTQTGNTITINNIIDNSPAKNNNLLPGDTILSIDGQHADKETIDKILSAENILEKKEVTLEIKRNNKIIEKKIKKTEIPIKTMDYKITDDNIAIITLATIMGDNAINDFANIIKKTNYTKGIIIDLRDNYGGVLSNAIEMANYMLDNEKIVSIESRGNNRFQVYAGKEKIFINKPIVILVNKKTASAAEILAGTLKQNSNAVIIGENTYGKNSIQQIIPMSNNTGLTITSNKYILPSGEDIHNKGITPDIIIKPQIKNKSGKHKDVVMDEGIKILTKMIVENNK